MATHIRGLKPEPPALVAAGHLAEALVMLGHERDAYMLQQRMTQLLDLASSAGAYVEAHPPPVGGGAGEGGAGSHRPVQWKWDLLREVRGNM